MRVLIHDVRAIKTAEITVSNIALITGKNTSGKSTIMNSVAHTLLGDRKLYGASSKKVEAVVREGTDIGTVEVSGKGWEKSSTWPGDNFESGTAPPVTVVTMGLEDPAGDYSAKDWSNFIRTLAPSKSKVGWKDFLAKMYTEGAREESDDDEDLQQLIYEKITKSWDAAAVFAKDRALQAKRDWTSATGETFGTDKSYGWQHPDFQEGSMPQDFHTTLKDLEAEYAKSVAQQEVTGGQLDELEAAYKAMADKQMATNSALQTNMVYQADNRTALGKFPGSRIYTCPCCNQRLEVSGVELVKYKVREYEIGSPAHEQLLQNKQYLEKQYNGIAEENGKLVAAMQADMTMIKKLRALDDSLDAPEIIKDQLDDVKKLLNAAQATIDAKGYFHRWKWFSTAERLLSASGMRFEATKAAVMELEPRITELAAYIFPEHDVLLAASDDGVQFLFDGRDYKTMSYNGDPNSYRLGIKTLVQILQAEQLGDNAPVLIDRFDTMDLKRQNGILSLFKNTGRPVIVAKTMAEKQAEDKLAKHGIGATYWINNGVLEAV